MKSRRRPRRESVGSKFLGKFRSPTRSECGEKVGTLCPILKTFLFVSDDESPPGSKSRPLTPLEERKGGEPAGYGSSVYVKQPPMLATQPSKSVPPRPSVEGARNGGGGEEPRPWWKSACGSYYYDLTLIISRDRIPLPSFAPSSGIGRVADCTN